MVAQHLSTNMFSNYVVQGPSFTLVKEKIVNLPLVPVVATDKRKFYQHYRARLLACVQMKVEEMDKSG